LEDFVSQLLQDVERLVEPALAQDGVELVDLSYQKAPGGWTLSFYIDKSGGVTLDDCAMWSGRFGEIIDASNLIDRAYVLEVSSPGLDRALRKPADFVRFSGRLVHAKLAMPLDGQRNFHGELLGGDATAIRLKLDTGRTVSLPLENVTKCRLKPEFNF
jgi:ribosome maturation factor RimP